MATSDVKVTPGTGKNVATYSFSEDSETKDVGRVVLNNSSGTEIGNSTTPVQVTLANTGTNSTAVKVDGSAVTQPVSAASLPLPSGASTAAKQPALGTAGTASSDVITIQGISSMTKLLVTPDANSAVNVAQLSGTTADTNSGTKSAGTLRVVLATDQPALTNKLLVTPDSVALPANQSVNVSQVSGTTADTNSGTKSAGTLRVVLATDQPALTNKLLVTADAITFASAQAVTQSGTWSVGHGKTCKTVTGSASATFTIVAAVSSKRIKVYSLSLITAATTAVTITFKDAASGTAVATYPLQAITATNFGLTENIAVPSFLFATSAGNLLEMAFSAAQTVTYNLRYFDDDAT